MCKGFCSFYLSLILSKYLLYYNWYWVNYSWNEK